MQRYEVEGGKVSAEDTEGALEGAEGGHFGPLYDSRVVVSVLWITISWQCNRFVKVQTSSMTRRQSSAAYHGFFGSIANAECRKRQRMAPNASALLSR